MAGFGLVLSLTKRPGALDKGAPGLGLYNIRNLGRNNKLSIDGLSINQYCKRSFLIHQQIHPALPGRQNALLRSFS
jgi:hypothetical protein